MTRLSETLEELLERCRKLPPMTPADARIQAISFAYGNAKFRNPDLTMEQVTAIYDKMHPETAPVPD